MCCSARSPCQTAFTLLQGTDVRSYITQYTPYFEETLATMQTDKAMRNFVLDKLTVKKDSALLVTEVMEMFEIYCKKLQLGKQKLHDHTIQDAFQALETRHRKRHREDTTEIYPKNTNGLMAADSQAYFLNVAKCSDVGSEDIFEDTRERSRFAEHRRLLNAIVSRQEQDSNPALRFLDH